MSADDGARTFTATDLSTLDEAQLDEAIRANVGPVRPGGYRALEVTLRRPRQNRETLPRRQTTSPLVRSTASTDCSGADVPGARFFTDATSSLMMLPSDAEAR